MSRTTSAARFLSALAIAAVLALVAPSLASAQPRQTVGELQTKAKQVAAELGRLRARSEQLDEDFLAAKAEVADLQAKLAAKQAAVSAAQTELDSTRSTAKEYAIQAYVSGGEVDPILLPSTDVADASHRSTYLSSLHSDRAQAMDDVRASQLRLGAEQKSLTAATQRVESKVAALDATQAELKSTIARQSDLQHSVDGQLAEAVRAGDAGPRRRAMTSGGITGLLTVAPRVGAPAHRRCSVTVAGLRRQGTAERLPRLGASGWGRASTVRWDPAP